MNLTAADIARLAEGVLRGNGALRITGAAPLEKAGPSDLTFLSDPALAPKVSAAAAGCLLAPPGTEDALKDFRGAVVFTKSPKYAFTLALRLVEKNLRPAPAPGIHSASSVSPSAHIGKDVHIGPFAVVEDGASVADGAVVDAQCYVGRNARVGRDARLYPGVKLMDACELGNDVIIHAGAVIGSDGYGYISPNGTHEKIPQLGKVVVEDNVEIGANVAIDRAALEVTLIGAGTKIDNLVHIAHNVKIGRNCLILAQAAIAGSSVIGDGVIIAGQAGITDHVTVGANTVIMGKTGVMSDIGPGQVLFGLVGRPRLQAMKIEALLGRLPEMHRTIGKIKKHLGI
jgi:UDP-3-O-[3-hydroxymyristoyl] glucosamine N-acyltransferase